MKAALCRSIERIDNRYYGVSMRIPVVIRKREGRAIDRAVELIVIASSHESLAYAKKLLQGESSDPLEEKLCRRVCLSEVTERKGKRENR